MTAQKIALVTGANRGIGFEICRQLAQQEVTVILTARSPEKGEKASATLKSEGLDVVFHQLDVTDAESISALENFVTNEFDRLDILVNNAGIYIDDGKYAVNVDLDTVRETLDTNLLGPLRLCQTFIPMMQTHNFGRIVNLSSGMGALHEMGSGYPSYRISKTGLNALTVILAAEVDRHNILVNTMCPGWVQTNMGGKNAPKSVEQGADTAVWLALLPDDGPSGKFFRDRNEIPW